MAQQGFSQDFDVDITQLSDKTFHTYRKSRTNTEANHYKWNPMNLINKHFMTNADNAYDNMKDAQLPRRIFQSRPDLVLNVGNEYLTMMLMEDLKSKCTHMLTTIAEYYDNSPLNMPSRQIWTRFVRDFKEFTLSKIDYAHFTVPFNAANSNNFVFPGEYVGQYGTYEAVKHIYESTESMKHLLEDDHLLVSKRYFASDVEKAVEGIRDKFRAKHGIAGDAYSIFLAPGNEQSEVEFCMETLRKGTKEFLLKYSAPTSLSPKALPLNENFVTVLSLHKGSPGEQWVREYLRDQEWTGRLVIVTDESNEHYDAMAASDFGFVHDGQMVSSANALHLPVMTALNMRVHHHWYHDLYNRWWNDMNIIADTDLNHELIGGECWFGKVADTLAENYVNAEQRYTQIKRADGFVQDAMSFKPLDRTVVRTRDLMLEDGLSYDQYYDPMLLTARNMLSAVDEYELGVGSSVDNNSGLKVNVARM